MQGIPPPIVPPPLPPSPTPQIQMPFQIPSPTILLHTFYLMIYLRQGLMCTDLICFYIFF